MARSKAVQEELKDFQYDLDLIASRLEGSETEEGLLSKLSSEDKETLAEKARYLAELCVPEKVVKTP